MADRLRAATPSGVSCSIGIALSGADSDLNELVTGADDALYAAKATGRNRVVLASRSTHEASASRRSTAVAAPAVRDGASADGELAAFERLLGDAGAVRFTALGDRFVSIAPEVQDVLGWHPEELLAIPFAELIHPDDRDAALAEAGRVSLAGTTVHGFETRLRCRDGRYRRLRLHALSDGTLWRAIALDLGDADEAFGEPAAA